LTRQDTHTSVFSWWSDSNSLLRNGPTINLHALAKPLMKRMYHRQASGLIRNNRGSPLSTAMVEIYSSYFRWDYVAWKTKVVIMEELSLQTYSENCAQTLVDSPVFHYIWEMVGSSDPVAKYSSRTLLGRLVRYKCTIPPIVKMGGCERLVALLDERDDNVVHWATSTLAEIAHWLEGAQAIVEAKVQDHVLKLLESQSSWVTACLLVEELASHEPTVPAVLDLNLLKQLVALAKWFHLGAIKALHTISRWPDGVAALADFVELQHIDYDDSDLPKLLENITRYKEGKPDSLHDGVDL